MAVNLEMSSQTCTSYRENQYKILMFWYHTPSLLQVHFPEVQDKCWRCGSEKGTLFLVHQVLGVRIPLSPLAFFLNVPPCKLYHKSSWLLLHILTAANCLIVTFWKQRCLPSFMDLHSQIKVIRTMKHLITLLNNQLDLYGSVWTPFQQHVAEHTTLVSCQSSHTPRKGPQLSHFPLSPFDSFVFSEFGLRPYVAQDKLCCSINLIQTALYYIM